MEWWLKYRPKDALLWRANIIKKYLQNLKKTNLSYFQKIKKSIWLTDLFNFGYVYNFKWVLRTLTFSPPKSKFWIHEKFCHADFFVLFQAVFERLVDIICDKMSESLDSDPSMLNSNKGTRLGEAQASNFNCNCWTKWNEIFKTKFGEHWTGICSASNEFL